MRTARGILVLASAALIALTGCASSTAAPRTVIVTETATAGTTDGSGVTVSGLPTTTSDPSVTVSGGSDSSASETTTSESMAPIIKLDPLKADCAKVENATELTRVFGALAAGTDKKLEGKTPDRGVLGKLRCQYGVNGATIAVQVILTSYTDAAAADAQVAVTVQSETAAGAKVTTPTVQGHPATVMIRDGGLIIVSYDTWTLSVVVDVSVTTEDKLPDALAQVADYSLTKILTQGG